MRFKTISQIIKKEFLALLRNYKVLVGVFAPLIILPLLFYGYQELASVTSREAEVSVSTIYVEGELPHWVYNSMNEELLINFTEDSDQADLLLSYDLKEGTHQFVLTYDFGRNAGIRAGERIAPILDEFHQEQQKKILESRGLDFASLYPAKISIEDLASEREVAGYSMSNIFPLLITLYAVLCVMSFAVELTTAEKEMGTLETLFSIPIKRVELIVAKLMACVVFGVLSLGINLGLLLLFIPKIMDVNIMGSNIDLVTFGALFVNIIPLIFIGSSMCIGLGMFANSYKESNAYLTPLVFMFMIPAYVGSTPGLELNLIYSLIPIVNTTLLMKSVFMSQVNIGLFALTFMTNALFSIMSLVFMFKVFGTEKLLFGSGKGFSFTVKRNLIPKKTFVDLDDTFLGLAVITVLFIYGSLLLPNYMGTFSTLAFVQYVFFGLMPIVVIWYLKASFKETLGLRVPPLKGLFGGVWVWISAFSLALIYQLIIMPYVNFVPTLEGLEDQLQQLSPFAKFFFIALTPGICEEILFRGFVLRPLEKKIGATWAVIISAIAFSLIHLDFVRLVPTFLLGLAFGYVAIKTRSIYPAIFLHVLNNSIAIFMPATIELSYLLLVPIFIGSLAIVFLFFEKGKSRIIKGLHIK